MSQRKAHHKRLATFCPACGSDVHFRRLPSRGSLVSCNLCHSLLEVTRLAPLTLEWAFEEPFDDGEFEPKARYGGRDGKSHEYYEEDPDGLGGKWEEDWEDNWDEDEFEE